ncbi:hypothetical protein [Streptomyces sp. 4F14]|uniref:hypothetical protein n=1 Tax=Streptomyces sp. 4F14 TaxID=3394380 RepID=UPI003A8AEE4B
MDPAAKTVGAALELPGTVSALTVSPDGTYVYTVSTADNTISVVDTASRAVTTLDYVAGVDDQEDGRLWKINETRDGLTPVRTLTGCGNVPFEDGGGLRGVRVRQLPQPPGRSPW